MEFEDSRNGNVNIAGLDLLIFGAHPDDAEIGMGGTIAKHTAAGIKVGICDLTRAEMSSNGTVELRAEETQKASQVLGLSSRTNLGLPDRGLVVENAQIEPIVREIRRFRPRAVFAPYYQDRHPDHTLCSHLVKAAVFNAKLRNYLPDIPPVQVQELYFYFINDLADPDLVVDVSAYYPLKREALSAYRSQFVRPASSIDEQFVATPLNQGYLERVEARDRLLGQYRMNDYAEGFISNAPVLLNLF